MIGRTNIPFGVSGAVDGVTIADLPTHLSSLTAAANSGRVVLTLGYSDTDFLSGVDVLYKTGSYPASPTDGECVTANGAVTEITVEGLTNGTKYFFRVYLWRLIGGVKYYQTDETNAKIYATPSAVGISGIEPVRMAENYILIANSGTFTLDIPEEITSVTAHIVGGGYNGSDGASYKGGSGGNGGYYLSATLNGGENVACSAAVGAIGAHTTFVFGDTTYKTSSGTYRTGGGPGKNGEDGWSTLYGYVGSSGGGGAMNENTVGYGGIGAGDGGNSEYDWDTEETVGEDGGNAHGYGCGGGGGGSVGDAYTTGSGGSGKQGCIIIEWA